MEFRFFSLSIKTLYVPREYLKAFALRTVGGCHPKDIIPEPFNYVEQNSYLKILIGRVWGSGGRGRGLVAPNHFRLLKRALALSISNRLSPFRSSYDSAFDTKYSGQKKKKKKKKYIVPTSFFI